MNNTSKEIGSCGAHTRLNVRIAHTGNVAVLHHLACEEGRGVVLGKNMC